jgi:hypothetical protein
MRTLPQIHVEFEIAVIECFEHRVSHRGVRCEATLIRYALDSANRRLTFLHARSPIGSSA